MITLIKTSNLLNLNFLGWDKYVLEPCEEFTEPLFTKLFPVIPAENINVLDNYLANGDITLTEYNICLKLTDLDSPFFINISEQYPTSIEELGITINEIKESAEVTYFSADTLEQEINYLIVDHSMIDDLNSLVRAYHNAGYSIIISA